jgi:hypothetical protein
MPWFRVDDSFWGHPKAIAAGPALALWLRAGCWSAQQLTDGFVPRGMLATLGGTPVMAKRLVDAKARPDGEGLWVAVEGGWRFHDWSNYQPSKADVEADRHDARERMRKAREAKRAAAANAGTSADVRANSERSSDNPGPARPGPTQPGTALLTLAGRLGEVDARGLADASLPAEVIATWQEAAGPGVDLEDEARAYLAHHGDTPPRHPRRAWLGWLAKARQHADAARPARPAPAPERAACGNPGCVGGWLPADDDRPVPCPTCRPHLRPVVTSEAS